MRTRTIIFLFICVSAAAFAAPPKVAVLDAVLPDGMEKQVAIGVTEKISEELVGSGKYTVLDRTTVGQSLKEIEFQMSGLMSDADIQKAGQQLNTRLGATFVVVARVSQLAGTYFVSAKLIDIKTGEITAQASYESEGGVAVTLSIAQVVGKKLALGAKETTQVPVEPVAAAQPVPQPAAQPLPEPTGLKSRIVFDALYPADAGTGVNSLVDGFEYFSGASDYSLSSYGFNFHWLGSLGLLYTSFYTGFTQTDVDWDVDIASLYNTLDFQVGLGLGLPLVAGLQLYGGVMVGYTFVMAGDYWSNYGDLQGTFDFGAEAGVDWVLFDFLVLNLRFHYMYMGFEAGDVFGDSYDFGSFGSSFGVGITM